MKEHSSPYSSYPAFGQNLGLHFNIKGDKTVGVAHCISPGADQGIFSGGGARVNNHQKGGGGAKHLKQSVCTSNRSGGGGGQAVCPPPPLYIPWIYPCLLLELQSSC